MKNIPELMKEYRVVTFDCRGHGNSSKVLQKNNISGLADDINELLSFLDLKKVLLVGWSLAGSVVMTYAHKYHENRLIGIGLLDSCLFPFSPDEWNSYNSRNYNMDDWTAKYRIWYTDPETYLDNFCNRMRNELSADELNMVRNEIRKMPPWIGFALHSDWCHRDCTPFLKESTVPFIIFSGTSKGHTPSLGRYYETQIRTYCEHHIFENAGHMLFWSHAEKFNQLIQSFIKRIS